jgi:membrane-associated phospholipid phosphatase
MKIKIFCLLAAILVSLSEICYSQNLDIDILKAINPMFPNSVYWEQKSASAYWVPGVILLGSLGCGFLRKNEQIKQNGYELLINIAASQLITEALKISINRERPADKYTTEIFVSSPTHGGSFPSGHTSLAFATATTLALDYKKWYVVLPAYLWAASVAYSRMYLGVHYPSDVLGGIIIGIGSGYLSHWLTKKLLKDKNHTYVQP